MGDNSQCNDFTISKRVHSLVIHTVAVNLKSTVTLLNSKAVQKSAFSVLKFQSGRDVNTSTTCDTTYYLSTSVLNIWIFCVGAHLKFLYNSGTGLQTLWRMFLTTKYLTKCHLPFWEILYPLLMTIRQVMERDDGFLQNSNVLHNVLLSN